VVVTGTGQAAAGTTVLEFDAFGLVTAKTITGGSSGSFGYSYDAASQGVTVTQTLGGQSYADRWYRMGGVNQWHWSNRFALADGDASTSGSSYTVRGGDTLGTIALALWGDASLWYKLAEANGLADGASLSDGQVLRVPSGVFRLHQTAATFAPYDAGKFIGPTDPSPLYPTPQPPKGGGCGVFGQILLAAIAIAVVAIAAPALIGTAATSVAGFAVPTTAGLVAVPTLTIAATGLTATLGAVGGAIAGGAIAGALGSAASQVVGLATGIQQGGFNWKAVGLAAISGAVGGGLSKVGSIPGIGNAANAAVRGTVASTLSQGIGVATGLQDKFSWAGVAGAGLNAGVTSNINVGPIAGQGGSASAANIAANLGRSMAGNIAGAAARSVIDGTDFGDNVLASLPDTIAQTIMDVAVRTVVKGGGGSGGSSIGATLQSLGSQAAAAGGYIAQRMSEHAAVQAGVDDVMRDINLKRDIRLTVSRHVADRQPIGLVEDAVRTASPWALAAAPSGRSAFEDRSGDYPLIFLDSRGIGGTKVGLTDFQKEYAKANGQALPTHPHEALVVKSHDGQPGVVKAAWLWDGQTGTLHTVVATQNGQIVRYTGNGEMQDFPEAGISVGYGALPNYEVGELSQGDLFTTELEDQNLGFLSGIEKSWTTLYNSVAAVGNLAAYVHTGYDGYWNKSSVSWSKAKPGWQSFGRNLVDLGRDSYTLTAPTLRPWELTTPQGLAQYRAANARMGQRGVGIVNGTIGAVKSTVDGFAMIHDGLVLGGRPKGYAAEGAAKMLTGGAEVFLTIAPASKLTKLGTPGRVGGAAESVVIPRIGGRLPLNSKYAGQVHPSGVRFTNQGFPDFGPYAKAEVNLLNLTGIYRTDAALANAAVGLKSTPKGFVWHHVEDGATLQLIPKSLNSSVKHTGGAAVIRNGGFDQ
jgi:hypothetical protein